MRLTDNKMPPSRRDDEDIAWLQNSQVPPAYHTRVKARAFVMLPSAIGGARLKREQPEEFSARYDKCDIVVLVIMDHSLLGWEHQSR